MTAEKVLELIQQLENDERWKLLAMLYNEYYNTGEPIEIEIEY